ncbi:MAG TPA: N,N-dimethylformamidase beta subunit family domain-containing protein [Nitrososphaeraceae archaeon]|nr:N,N-dimethylformamidase beta subunit family domain-containing protein [Nitrososphaeraceae archaeon]
MLGKWKNIDAGVRYVRSAVVIAIIVVLSTAYTLSCLSNTKFVFAPANSTSIRITGRNLYSTLVPVRLSSSNKLKPAAAATSASEPLPLKAVPPSLTTSLLSSIITKIKEGKNNSNNRNNSNLTKDSHSPSFLHDINDHTSSKTKSTTSLAFRNGAGLNNNDNNNDITVAFIKPSFTAAAYHHSFYVFYMLYRNSPTKNNITTDLNLLSSKVNPKTTDSSHSALAMYYLSRNIKSIIPKSKIDMLTDADVDAGNIFTVMKNNNKNNGNYDKSNNKYDILVIGHQEYVTQQEYDNLRQFVSHGGTLIILDGNIFYAEVKYNRNTQTITLVKGHGWAFNGKSAWRSVAERWKQETSEWAGSNYLCYSCSIIFDNDPFEYKHHEEQYITNSNDTILFNYDAFMPSNNNNNNLRLVSPTLTSSSSHLLSSSKLADIAPRRIIATYELKYQRGKVIALGIYADDIITNNKFDRYFDNLLLTYIL